VQLEELFHLLLGAKPMTRSTPARLYNFDRRWRPRQLRGPERHPATV